MANHIDRFAKHEWLRMYGYRSAAMRSYMSNHQSATSPNPYYGRKNYFELPFSVLS